MIQKKFVYHFRDGRTVVLRSMKSVIEVNQADCNELKPLQDSSFNK